MTDENVPTLFENEDIICEAFDVPENKTMLVNAVLENLRARSSSARPAWPASAAPTW